VLGVAAAALLVFQVMDVSTSKTGKHGHAKCNFVTIDIFTGKKYEEMTPSSHNMDVSGVTTAHIHTLSVSLSVHAAIDWVHGAEIELHEQKHALNDGL
jgi:translation elongation factor P/translation initiation factor 5A